MQIESLELTIYNKIKSQQNKVLFLPIDIWINLINYGESVEDYETCQLLLNLIDIVILQTFSDFIEQDDREWHNKQSLNESW
jgi:hypothetical protein